MKLVRDWAADENYSHGFLVVPVVGYILWRERARLAAIPTRPSTAGLAIVIGNIGVLVVGLLGAELFLSRLAMLGTLAGLVVFLWGRSHVSAMRFAFLLLFLAIPIPSVVFNQITFPLQLLASRFGELSISACGIPVLREGNVITLASTTLEVAEACSGIRSLVSLATLALLLGYFTGSPRWLRWVLALASVPIAIFANGIRVAGTGIAAHFAGPRSRRGFLPHVLGLAGLPRCRGPSPAGPPDRDSADSRHDRRLRKRSGKLHSRSCPVPCGARCLRRAVSAAHRNRRKCSPGRGAFAGRGHQD